VGKKERKKRTIKKRNELFKQLIEPNLNLVYSVCKENTRNPYDVDDNYQECLINFYNYIETYDKTRPLPVWIHVVTKRHVIDAEKKRRKVFFTSIDENPYATKELSNGQAINNEINIDNYADGLSDEVLEAINSIPKIRRDTMLRQLSGYRLKEIMDEDFKNGTLKNKNLETVKSRIFLGRQYLKDKLSDYNDSRGDY